jgi:hypothetical protein
MRCPFSTYALPGFNAAPSNRFPKASAAPRGTNVPQACSLRIACRRFGASVKGQQMNSIIYLVGLVVVVLAVLSLIGLR